MVEGKKVEDSLEAEWKRNRLIKTETKFEMYLWKTLKEHLKEITGIKIGGERNKKGWRVFGLGNYITVDNGKIQKVIEVAEEGGMFNKKYNGLYKFLEKYHPELIKKE